MFLFRRLTAAVTAVALLATTLPLPAHAGLVRTDEAIAATSSVQRRMHDLLARAEVREQLAARGVDPRAVEARVAALTDDEARLLAERIDQLPAGGSDVLGVLLAVFLILLITDILGLTRVFPFTRPVR
jgi:hypothetical protein